MLLEDHITVDWSQLRLQQRTKNLPKQKMGATLNGGYILSKFQRLLITSFNLHVVLLDYLWSIMYVAICLDILCFVHFKVEGGSNLSIKFSWSQKLLYQDGQFNLTVPFCFPTHITPAGKKIPKREKIQLNVNSGTGTEILCKATSHLLKVCPWETFWLRF